MKRRNNSHGNYMHSLIESTIRGTLRRKLNESRDTFNEDRFNEWEENTHIPDDVMSKVEAIFDQIGINLYGEETIRLVNRGGHTYGYGKGFSYSFRTSSMADGPDADYSGRLKKSLGQLGFEVAGSYGDNGMDSATNWRDTWWTYDFVYRGTVRYVEDFMDWGDEDEDEDYDDYEDYDPYEDY